MKLSFQIVMKEIEGAKRVANKERNVHVEQTTCITRAGNQPCPKPGGAHPLKVDAVVSRLILCLYQFAVNEFMNYAGNKCLIGQSFAHCFFLQFIQVSLRNPDIQSLILLESASRVSD